MPQPYANQMLDLLSPRTRELVVADVAATCAHDPLVVHHANRDLSDIETEYGHCSTCDAWIVRTHWLSRDRYEDAPMREATAMRLQAIADRYRRGDAT